MNRLLTEPACLLLWLLLLLQAPVAGASGPQGEIRFRPASEGSTWVGQELELQLELWSDGLSFGDQLFVLPEVTGGFLLQADSNTVKLSENRDGVAWQGLSYTLLFYPQREGRLEIPSFEVRYTASTGYGSAPTPFQFQTSPLFVDARLPPGVDRGSLLVTTGSFELESSWTPGIADDGPVQLKVGDALSLEVTRRAQEVPGMVFAPLPVFSIDGLGVYPASPAVNDRINRGALTGNRTDAITFICEREGNYEIPEMRFQWWDPERETLAEKLIPAVQLVVAANPAYATSQPAARNGPGQAVDWKVITAAGVLLVLLIYPARLLARRLAAGLRAWQKNREASESWAFQRVQKACAGGDSAAAYHSITIWLGRFYRDRAGLTLIGLAAESGDRDLLREVTLLQDNMVSGSADEWSGGDLARLLVTFRKQARNQAKSGHVLHPLNPPAVREP